jgi:hypothetical protein
MVDTTDNLQQPQNPVEMKVFQGGGAIGSGVAPESLLALPDVKAPMMDPTKNPGAIEALQNVVNTAQQAGRGQTAPPAGPPAQQ